MRRGIDISKHNGLIDFDQLKSAIDFLFIKASSGSYLRDDLLTRNRAAADRVGLPYGLYHYAYPEYNNPETEADWFALVVGERGNHALALDYESSWTGDKVSWCKRFLQRLSSHYNGYTPFIYLNLNTVRANDWSSVAPTYPLWLAHWDYTTDSPLPTDLPWSTISLRQYSNQETIPGCPGVVDGDIFYDDSHPFLLASVSSPLIVESLGREFQGDQSYTVMRQVPSDDYQEVESHGEFGSHFNQGWSAPVIKEQGDWYLISLGGGVQQGWVKKTYLTLPGKNEPLLIAPFRIRSTVDNLRLRVQPSLHAQIIRKLSKGATVDCENTVAGDAVNGNSMWYRTITGLYVTAAYTTKI